MPEILILVDWFYPGYRAGGPIVSTLNLAVALRDRYRIKIYTTDTDLGTNEPYPGIKTGEWNRDVIQGVDIFYARKDQLGFSEMKSFIANSGADYVYLNHVFSPKFVLLPLWLKLTGQLKSEVVVCPRGGLFPSALAIKTYKKWPVLKLLRWMGIARKTSFHATNAAEKEAILLHFPGSSINIADNLPFQGIAAHSVIEKSPGELKCIFVGRVLDIKNLLLALKALRSLTAKVQLTIVGPVEDQAYWKTCQETIDALPENITVHYAGALPKFDVIAAIQQHHLFVLPTRGENYGHAIIEGLISGRPVLISDQTPWRGLQEKGIGWDLPLDEQAFASAMNQAAQWTQSAFDGFAGRSYEFARDYASDPKLVEPYFEIFK
ncbi:MAG: glycosyltransferase [Bacteroidota bacterium]